MKIKNKSHKKLHTICLLSCISTFFSGCTGDPYKDNSEDIKILKNRIINLEEDVDHLAITRKSLEGWKELKTLMGGEFAY